MQLVITVTKTAALKPCGYEMALRFAQGSLAFTGVPRICLCYKKSSCNNFNSSRNGLNFNFVFSSQNFCLIYLGYLICNLNYI